MEEIKKQRPEKDAKSSRRRYAAEEIHRNRHVLDGFQAIANASWAKYLAGAFVAVVIGLMTNYPLVKHIHLGSRMAEIKDEHMKKFMSKMDLEDSLFQQNLLKKFRSIKKMEIKNVTDDDLRASKFFD